MNLLKTSLGTLFPVLLLVSTQVLAAEFTLRIHHFLGDDSLPHKALIEPWARRVEADSNGRIAVEIYPKMELGGKTEELINQVLDGTVDIVWTAAAYTPNRFPHAEVFTLPLVHEGNPAATNQAIMSVIGDLLYEDFKGMKPLLAHVQVGHSLHLSRKTVNTLSDIEGLAIRPAGRRVGLWVVDALGATPSTKRHPKLSEALAENKLDGALMSFQLAQSLDVIESVKSHTLRAENKYFGTSLFFFLMNQARYDALPADLQAVIDRNSGMGLAKQVGETWQEAEAAALATARARGNVVTVLNDSDQQLVEKAFNAILVRWSDTVRKYGIDGPQLIEKARQAISGFQQR